MELKDLKIPRSIDETMSIKDFEAEFKSDFEKIQPLLRLSIMKDTALLWCNEETFQALNSLMNRSRLMEMARPENVDWIRGWFDGKDAAQFIIDTPDWVKYLIRCMAETISNDDDFRKLIRGKSVKYFEEETTKALNEFADGTASPGHVKSMTELMNKEFSPTMVAASILIVSVVANKLKEKHPEYEELVRWMHTHPAPKTQFEKMMFAAISGWAIQVMQS